MNYSLHGREKGIALDNTVPSASPLPLSRSSETIEMRRCFCEPLLLYSCHFAHVGKGGRHLSSLKHNQLGSRSAQHPTPNTHHMTQFGVMVLLPMFDNRISHLKRTEEGWIFMIWPPLNVLYRIPSPSAWPTTAPPPNKPPHPIPPHPPPPTLWYLQLSRIHE